MRSSEGASSIAMDVQPQNLFIEILFEVYFVKSMFKARVTVRISPAYMPVINLYVASIDANFDSTKGFFRTRCIFLDTLYFFGHAVLPEKENLQNFVAMDFMAKYQNVISVLESCGILN